MSKVPFEQVELPAETKALLKEALFFEPVPELERVVFIATPHRGSFRAVSWVQALVRRMITMPGRLVTDTAKRLQLAGAQGLGNEPASHLHRQHGAR